MKKKLIILLLSLTGCGSGAFYTSNTGTVIKTEPNMVCVVYDVLSGSGGQTINCYYYEKGHFYSTGDKYPDFSKNITEK